MKKVLLVPLLALLAACQGQVAAPPLPDWQSPEERDSAELGVIRDLCSGEQLSPAQLLDRLAAAPRVIVGEQHDNPDHHALELWLVRALAERRFFFSLTSRAQSAPPRHPPRRAICRAT